MPFWPFKVFQSKSATVGDIVADYGTVLEENSNVIMDIDSLPFSKTKIKEAIKQAYSVSTSEYQRDALETGYVLLSSFQDGVGKAPIRLDPAMTGDLKRDTDAFGNLTRWLTLQQADMTILSEEWQRFKATVKP